MFQNIVDQRKGESFPFGPYLSAGIMIAALWGDKIYNWYLNLMIN